MDETIYPFPSDLVDNSGRVVAEIGCPRCGCNLQDMLLDGPCPECGVRLLPLFARYFDLNGNLMADFFCTHCRYDLRGLTWKHHCPECGQPVMDSLRNPATDFEWLVFRQKLRTLGQILLLILMGALVYVLIVYLTSP
jgi:hypothetical protein